MGSSMLELEPGTWEREILSTTWLDIEIISKNNIEHRASVLEKLLITLSENDDQEMKFLGKFLSSRELNALVNLHQKVQVTSEYTTWLDFNSFVD